MRHKEQHIEAKNASLETRSCTKNPEGNRIRRDKKGKTFNAEKRAGYDEEAADTKSAMNAASGKHRSSQHSRRRPNDSHYDERHRKQTTETTKERKIVQHKEKLEQKTIGSKHKAKTQKKNRLIGKRIPDKRGSLDTHTTDSKNPRALLPQQQNVNENETKVFLLKGEPRRTQNNEDGKRAFAPSYVAGSPEESKGEAPEKRKRVRKCIQPEAGEEG